ncbi:hypothetical protein G4177_15110 [Corallococcus sp. ZKHCc1 1396]|uniref:Lantibiotic dehydratase N-terminal domain-containing protein n=1 Tax=Corallococcus soli TaxID=2710757 RepID=A0ABR9PNJ4_9BACT|nr:lantibiotic dehydratase [Corallococcus soli]MBE4749493.1 hypothetical protein [Corallococcus soli]
MDPFVSARCMEQLAHLDRLTAQLKALRSDAADALFAALPGADPSIRHFLLNVKRDCFNHRPLHKYRKSPQWEQLPPTAALILERVLGQEQEIEAGEQAFRKSYLEDRETGHQWLLEQGRQPSFLRAVSLASAGLVEYLDRLYLKPQSEYGKRERKTEQSLLRYFSRSVVKLSPYSTFTKVALGLVTEGQDPAYSIRVLDEPWSERSLLRVKRYLLDQSRELLFQHPRAREALAVVLNDTIEDLGEGQHRFLRPLMLERDVTSGELRFTRPSQVRVRLSGPLITWLKTQLNGRSRSYREVQHEAAAAFDEAPERLDATFAKLINIGFLQLVPPWSTIEFHLEQHLLHFVRGLLPDAGLEPLVGTLESLIELEKQYSGSKSPLASVKEIDRLVARLFEQIQEAVAGDALALRLEKVTHNYYEDVLLHTGEHRSPSHEVVHVDPKTAEELLSQADLLWRLANLFEPRHEIHHALWAFAERRWPGRAEIPFLEFFAEAQPLWEQALAHRSSSSQGGTFNPFGLEEVESLQHLREELRRAIPQIYRQKDGETQVQLDALQRLVDGIPARYAPLVGPCLFAQPADARGSQWVANRFFEGTGRCGSRFTAIMGPPALTDYTDHYERGSRRRMGEETAELLDTLFIRGNTVGIHAPQTPRILEIPGEFSLLPESRRLQLRDLVLRADPLSRSFTIRDRQGQRLIPSYLSSLQNEFLASPLKFLDVFGTMARSTLMLPTHGHERDGITVAERLTLGRLVVRRRRWVIPPERMPRWEMPEPDAFLAINRWREALGLPVQVYLIEKVTAEAVSFDVFKPQYIDFRSPALVALFQTVLSTGKMEQVTLEEALPTPEAYPTDVQGRRWGVEVILDSLVIPRTHPTFP